MISNTSECDHVKKFFRALLTFHGNCLNFETFLNFCTFELFKFLKLFKAIVAVILTYTNDV